MVGQGSSIIDFTIKNTGYGYGNNQTLTVAIGGTIGIPTDTTKTFEEFKIEIDEIASDEFTGWSLENCKSWIISRDLSMEQELTSQSKLMGLSLPSWQERDQKLMFKTFSLYLSITSFKFPGQGYVFTGGSQIEFTEAPKIGDSVQIIFYKGTGAQDVVLREIIETVKEGDTLQIQNNDIFTMKRKICQLCYLELTLQKQIHTLVRAIFKILPY